MQALPLQVVRRRSHQVEGFLGGRKILASANLWETACPSFWTILIPTWFAQQGTWCQHGIHHDKILPCSPACNNGFMCESPPCFRVHQAIMHLAMRPSNLMTFLESFTPAQLINTRNAIDALLTPDALQQANQQLSPLLRLPPNILDRIVEYAVSYDQEVDDSSKEPGLLQTCYALRLAASRAYFSRNTFKRKRSFREEELERWAKVRVGENRKFLGRVRLGPPLHCNNDEAEEEARKLENKCSLRPGSVCEPVDQGHAVISVSHEALVHLGARLRTETIETACLSRDIC